MIFASGPRVPFSGLIRWRDALIGVNALQHGAYGCALGSMASELADTDEQARVSVAGLFRAWEELLAVGLMTALQGGYLLASTSHDVRPMEIALDLALDHVKSYLTGA